MGQTTQELVIVTKIQDLASSEFRKVGAAAGEVTKGVEGIGKASVHVAGLNKTARDASIGLLLMAGNAQGASGAVAGLVSNGLGAFMAGGPLSAGLSVVGSLIGIIGKNSSEAAEKAQKLREAQQQAAKEAKDAADATIKQQNEYNAAKQKELDLIQAIGAADKQKVKDRQSKDEAFEKGGAEGLNRENQRQKAEAGIRTLTDEIAKRSEVEAIDKKRLATAIEQDKAEQDGLVSLREQADEYLRLARLSAEQLKYDRELSLAKKLRASDGSNRGRADQIEADVKKKMAADSAKEDDRKKKESTAQADAANETIRHAKEALQVAQQQTEEARKRVEREAELQDLVDKNASMSSDQLHELIRLTKEKYAADDAAAARASSERNTTTYDPVADEKKKRMSRGEAISQTGSDGGVVDLRAQARAAKSQRNKDARTRRRNANYLAERGENPGIIDGDDDGTANGWGSGGGDMDGRKGTRFSKPSGKVNLPVPLADPVYPGGNGQPASGKGGGSGYGAVTPGDVAATDNSAGTQAKNLAEAIKLQDEKMKSVAEALEKGATAAEAETASIERVSTSSDKLTEAVSKNSDKVGAFAEAVTAATTATVTKVDAISTKLDALVGQLKTAGFVSG